MIFYPISCKRETEIVMFFPFLNFWCLCVQNKERESILFEVGRGEFFDGGDRLILLLFMRIP
jgi:hypothetical protein